MKAFDTLRQLAEELQKNRQRAVRAGDKLPNFSDAIEELRRIPESPPIGQRPTEPERTPLQAAIWEFVREIWRNGNYPRTSKIRRRMDGSEVWERIAAEHGVSTNLPDWHTINRTLGREV